MICPGCNLPSYWSYGFGMRWCGMCGYLEEYVKKMQTVRKARGDEKACGNRSL